MVLRDRKRLALKMRVNSLTIFWSDKPDHSDLSPRKAVLSTEYMVFGDSHLGVLSQEELAAIASFHSNKATRGNATIPDNNKLISMFEDYIIDLKRVY
jgi:hypothetical protein